MNPYIAYIKRSKLNHSRVEHYKITHDGVHPNFLIHPDYLFEKELKFVYNNGSEAVEKIIPLKYIGPHLRKKMFWTRDELTMKREFRGVAYSIPEEVVFNY